jgi:predicted chitinase
LPRGYKSGNDNGVGPKLGYILTNIGHSIKDNDWVTKLEAQTIILDEPEGIDIPFGALTVTDESTGETNVTVITNTSGTVAAVKPIAVSKNVKQNLDEIEKACRAQGLTNEFIIKAIKANVLKETGGVPQNENLSGYANTSNERIRKIFGSRFANVSEADLTTIKKNTPEFAEYIYGLKSGKTGRDLGNTQPGDGYKFRGRGYIQITGRDLYTRAGKALGKDFVNNPDSINTPENAAASTVWYIRESLKIVAPRSDYKLSASNPQPKDQLQANLLITNCVGGVGLRLTRPSKSAIFNEIIAKVDRYSSQLA